MQSCGWQARPAASQWTSIHRSRWLAACNAAHGIGHGTRGKICTAEPVEKHTRESLAEDNVASWALRPSQTCRQQPVEARASGYRG